MTDSTTRWVLLVEYDGSGFVGWQHQPSGSSVQDALENALGQLTQHPVRVVGAGRTDAGVHALGQVAAFSASKRLRPDNIVRGGNSFLPPSVRIRCACEVAPDFNPRRMAIRRYYRYRVADGEVAPGIERHSTAWIPGRTDWNLVRAALEQFCGSHDFSAFRSSRCTAKRTRLTLERAELTLADRGPIQGLGHLAEFHFECRSFLHSMVRMLVGAALEAGKDRISLEELRGALENGQRGKTTFPTAPPEGLCLVRVDYPEGLLPWSGGVFPVR